MDRPRRLRVVGVSDERHKRCTRCGSWRPVAQFQTRSSKLDGREAACWPCRRDEQRERAARRRAADTKRCCVCREHKPREMFYRERAQRDGLSARCKPCDDARNLGRRRRYRSRMFLLAGEAAGGLACRMCGEDDPVVLHFHHRDPSTKLEGVSRLISDSAPWERVVEEAKKCAVLCANCHLRLHYGTAVLSYE